MLRGPSYRSFSQRVGPAFKGTREWHRRLTFQSYIKGPAEPSLLECSIPQHFSTVVSQHGDRTAVISHHQRQHLTYGALHHRSDCVARGLAKAGVKKGDRCAVLLGNNLEYAILTYALFKLGAILVPLNPGFSEAQIDSALMHLSAAHLVISAETNLSRKPPRSNVEILKRLGSEAQGERSPVVPSLSNLFLVDNSEGRVDVNNIKSVIDLRDVEAEGSSSSQTNFTFPLLSPEEVVNIQFTSGTTSAPKAAMLTHRNILNNGKSIGDRMLLTPDDVVCCPPPLFHCFGCILGYMATATHASAIVFPSEAFDPLASLHAVQEHRCTALYGVPTMFLAELELLANGTVSERGLLQLRTGIAAGSSIPAELMRKLHKQLNLTELTICYGMTETSPVSAMTTTDDPLAKRIETVGRLLPHVEAKIVDPIDRNRILGVGERGELAVAGYLVMKGYWGDKARTDEVLVADEQGKLWMHTGDEASIDQDGYVTITGRIKDLIIRGGENIHPLEIESCLLGHPDIKEVAVVGIPDERYGEVIGAFIITRSREDAHSVNDIASSPPISEQDVRNWVNERLGKYLVPKHVFWVDDYPKTASGKIQKFKLRQLGVELLSKSAS